MKNIKEYITESKFSINSLNFKKLNIKNITDNKNILKIINKYFGDNYIICKNDTLTDNTIKDKIYSYLIKTNYETLKQIYNNPLDKEKFSFQLINTRVDTYKVGSQHHNIIYQFNYYFFVYFCASYYFFYYFYYSLLSYPPFSIASYYFFPLGRTFGFFLGISEAAFSYSIVTGPFITVPTYIKA